MQMLQANLRITYARNMWKLGQFLKIIVIANYLVQVLLMRRRYKETKAEVTAFKSQDKSVVYIHQDFSFSFSLYWISIAL